MNLSKILFVTKLIINTNHKRGHSTSLNLQLHLISNQVHGQSISWNHTRWTIHYFKPSPYTYPKLQTYVLSPTILPNHVHSLHCCSISIIQRLMLLHCIHSTFHHCQQHMKILHKPSLLGNCVHLSTSSLDLR